MKNLGIEMRRVWKYAASMLSVVLCIWCAASFAKEPPDFHSYPVQEIKKEAVKSVNLKSHPRAKRFKTQLRKAVGKVANFAGHYVVVTWGCGSFCEAVALVDADSGKVYFAPFSVALGAEFHIDSKLFVDSPPSEIKKFEEGAPDGGLFHTNYYVWDESKKTFFPLPSEDEERDKK